MKVRDVRPARSTVELPHGIREYDIELHITCETQDGRVVTTRDHAYSQGRNAGEAAERAVAAMKRLLPKAKIEAGGARRVNHE